VRPPWHLAGILKAGYKAALKDRELLSLKEEAALLTARTMQLLERMKSEGGAAYEATWAELRAVILEKAKVSKTEWRRVVDLNNVITLEQAMSFADALMAAAMIFAAFT
jgi:hypothetical protein